MTVHKPIGVLVCTALLGGCATMPTPRNRAGARFQQEQQLADQPLARCALPAAPAKAKATPQNETWFRDSEGLWLVNPLDRWQPSAPSGRANGCISPGLLGVGAENLP